MKKAELAKDILITVGNLENAYVSDFNKRVLSELAEEEFTGDIDGDAVKTAKEMLQTFLNKTWRDKPESHKYVIGSCLALAFLFEKPLHPKEKVHYIECLVEGKETYYCPYNEPGTICDFCAAIPMTDKS